MSKIITKHEALEEYSRLGELKELIDTKFQNIEYKIDVLKEDNNKFEEFMAHFHEEHLKMMESDNQRLTKLEHGLLVLKTRAYTITGIVLLLITLVGLKITIDI